MKKSKVFYGDNADNNFLQMVKKEYQFYKILIVVGEKQKAEECKIINSLCCIAKKCEIVEFATNCQYNELCNQLVKKQLTDDVGLIVVIGEQNWVNPITQIYDNTAYVVLNPSINEIKVNSKFIVYDFSRVQKCSLHNFVGCVGEIGSIMAYVIEQVFQKSIYGLKFETRELLIVEKILFNFALLPQKVLQSKFGKQYVCKLALKIAKYIDDEFYNSNVYKLACNICSFNKSKFFKLGYSQMYSAQTLFKAFDFLFNVDGLNALIGYNAFNRLNFTKKYDKNLKTSFVSENFKNFNYDRNTIKANFEKIKNSFKLVLENYIQKFEKMFKNFNNLQYDKGVSNLKFLKSEIIDFSFNRLPEQTENANFATFLREFGFLNKF